MGTNRLLDKQIKGGARIVTQSLPYQDYRSVQGPEIYPRQYFELELKLKNGWGRSKNLSDLLIMQFSVPGPSYFKSRHSFYNLLSLICMV